MAEPPEKFHLAIFAGLEGCHPTVAHQDGETFRCFLTVSNGGAVLWMTFEGIVGDFLPGSTTQFQGGKFHPADRRVWITQQESILFVIDGQRDICLRPARPDSITQCSTQMQYF